MKTIRNMSGKGKTLPTAPGVTEQVFVLLRVSPSICQSCALLLGAASAGWLPLGHLLQRICVSVSCGYRVTGEEKKPQRVAGFGFFSFRSICGQMQIAIPSHPVSQASYRGPTSRMGGSAAFGEG